jgi:tRNA(fMet)-specific endonuclease VapC
MSFLLDTDTCIAAMRGREGAVNRLSRLSPDECRVSTVTVYELEVGVAKCREPQKERAKVARFWASVQGLAVHAESARRAGELRADLEKRGAMIGPYDVLLAGQCLAHGLKLISGNLSEFSRVPGLQVEGW